jgi:hypothetical protein
VDGICINFSSNYECSIARSTVPSGWGDSGPAEACGPRPLGGIFERTATMGRFVGLCRARGTLAHDKHSSLPCTIPHGAQQRLFLIFLCFHESDIQIFVNVFKIAKNYYKLT